MFCNFYFAEKKIQRKLAFFKVTEINHCEVELDLACYTFKYNGVDLG